MPGTFLVCGLLLASGCSGEKRVPDDAGASARSHAVEERDGVWWLVDPAGRSWFSLGVCVVDQGVPREKYDAARPAHAAWRHYPTPVAWADATIDRLRSWGFTTVGGWGDYASLRLSPRMDLAVMPVLGAGMEAGAPWFDLWDPAVVARIEEIARPRIAAVADYPGLVGYYTDNEQGWWNGILWKMTLEHDPRSGQRQRLLGVLRETYRGEWSALLRDFDPEGAGSFDELERGGVLFLRPGGDGIRAMRAFLELVAGRYYELLAAIVRRHDPRGLILGDRYQSFYYPEVVRAAQSHVDVVSTNLNAPWTDGTFARFFLDTLHDLAGKPLIVSEFYMCAAENRSGNPNDRGLFPIARTQVERASGFRRTLTALLELPYVIGAEWFQYYDEPPGGRDDGENFNFGLVDIEGRPYDELIRTARGIDASELHARGARRRPDASAGVPPAPAEPLGSFQPNVALREWDRERGFVRPASATPVVDLYICWSPDALHLGILAMDPEEAVHYRDGRMPEIDRMEWTIDLGLPGGPIRLRLGANLPPSGAPEGITARCISGPGLRTRVVAAVSVPARLLGRPGLAPGDAIEFASAVTTQARAYRTEWKGRFEIAR